MIPLLVTALFGGGGQRVRANVISAESSDSGTSLSRAIFNRGLVGGNGWAGGEGTVSNSADFEWLILGAQGDYSVRFTQTSGDAINYGDALNTWHNLASIVEIGLEATSLNVLEGSGEYEIRVDATGSIVGSNTWSLKSTSEV